MTILEILHAAMLAHTSVCLRYFGTGDPRERTLFPVTMTQTHLHAREDGDNTVKMYRIADLELVIDGVPSARITTTPTAHYADLASLGNWAHQTLTPLGWHVELSANQIGIHKRRKNGKPLAAAELVMSYSATKEIIEYRRDGTPYVAGTEPRQRPYNVGASTFADFIKAQLRFVDLVTALTNQPSTK